MENAAPHWLVLTAALALAATHLLAGRLRFLDATPRSRWLSFAAGISVAYVFVHLLPELAAADKRVQEAAEGVLPFLEGHAYLLALAGLTLFYGVERASRASREQRADDTTGPGAFWLSVASFATYNALIGYLLVRGEADTVHAVVLFAVAMGLHFVVNDHSLREHHKDAYRRYARWLLAAVVVVGWAVGRLTEVSEQALALVLAFIAGGVILNVIKEELPSERGARLPVRGRRGRLRRLAAGGLTGPTPARGPGTPGACGRPRAGTP